MNKTPKTLRLGDDWAADLHQDWSFPADVIDAWRGLARSHGDWGVFVSHGWFESWYRGFGTDGDLLVVVLRRNDEVKAIFPCRIDHGGISAMTNDHTCYYDFLVDSGVRGQALSKFVDAIILISGDADTLFDALPANSENIALLRRACSERGMPVHAYSTRRAPWMEVSGDWDQYHRRLPSRLRSSLKRCRKKAQEKGELTFEILGQSGELDELLDVLFEIEFRSWKGRQGTAIKSDPRVERFYRQLARWAMNTDSLAIYLLKIDGQPIAGSFCLASGKTVFLLKPGYDEAFGALSPGTLLQAEILKYLFAKEEVANYNFLGACDAWKIEWTSKTAESTSMVAYSRSLVGWSRYAFRHGWKDFLRRYPAAIKVYERMRNRTQPAGVGNAL